MRPLIPLMQLKGGVGFFPVFVKLKLRDSAPDSEGLGEREQGEVGQEREGEEGPESQTQWGSISFCPCGASRLCSPPLSCE